MIHFPPKAGNAQFLRAVGAIAICAFAGLAVADELQLIGTWRLLSGKYNGKEGPISGPNTMLKHVTPEQAQWVMYDRNGKVVEVAGGAYTVKGTEYIETFSYGLGPNYNVIQGKSHVFQYRVEGNKWYHTGQLANGLRIEEVWERVEKK